MYNGLKYILTFLSGAAISAAVTYKIVKVQMDRKIQEEVDSFKEEWANRQGEQGMSIPPAEKQKKAAEEMGEAIEEYGQIISDYTSHEGEEGGSESMENFGPAVIKPEEYGEIDEFDTIELTYYADEVLTDDLGEPLEDIEGSVGANFADHFGEYEEDSVYIRNNALKTDYEILRVEQNYSDLDPSDN